LERDTAERRCRVPIVAIFQVGPVEERRKQERCGIDGMVDGDVCFPRPGWDFLTGWSVVSSFSKPSMGEGDRQWRWARDLDGGVCLAGSVWPADGLRPAGLQLAPGATARPVTGDQPSRIIHLADQPKLYLDLTFSCARK
jgi:hypothetical protein